MSRNTVENPYALLGTTKSSSDEEIRKMYLRAMREAHPDRGGSDSVAAELNAAYALIRTASAREKWMQKRELFGAVPCTACDGAGGKRSRVKGGSTVRVCSQCSGAGCV